MMHPYRSLPKPPGSVRSLSTNMTHAALASWSISRASKSHDIVQKGLQVLDNLTIGELAVCDPLTGDGAGMLMQIPHEFLVRETKELRFDASSSG